MHALTDSSWSGLRDIIICRFAFMLLQYHKMLVQKKMRRSAQPQEASLASIEPIAESFLATEDALIYTLTQQQMAQERLAASKRAEAESHTV